MHKKQNINIARHSNTAFDFRLQPFLHIKKHRVRDRTEYLIYMDDD